MDWILKDYHLRFYDFAIKEGKVYVLIFACVLVFRRYPTGHSLCASAVVLFFASGDGLLLFPCDKERYLLLLCIRRRNCEGCWIVAHLPCCSANVSFVQRCWQRCDQETSKENIVLKKCEKVAVGQHVCWKHSALYTVRQKFDNFLLIYDNLSLLLWLHRAKFLFKKQKSECQTIWI